MSQALGIDLQAGALSAAEEMRRDKLAENTYASEGWTRRV
jgi:lipoate-protein ligase A